VRDTFAGPVADANVAAAGAAFAHVQRRMQETAHA